MSHILFSKHNNLPHTNALHEDIEPNLSTIISIIEEQYADNYKMQKSKIIDFIVNSTSNLTKRTGMEYFIQQGEVNLLEKLLEAEKTSPDPTNREWAFIYEILLMKNKGLLYGDRLNQAVLSMNSSSKEMHLLLCILHMFGVFQIGEYESLFKVSRAILPEVQQIEDPFIRTSYKLHLLELYCYSHLLMNQLEECRNTAISITTNTRAHHYPNTTINAYHVLAQSYMFESFEKTIDILNKAYTFISLLPEGKADSKRKEINMTRDFVHSLWRRDLDSNPEDLIERAHRYIVRGEKEKGLSILDEAKLKQGNNLTAFQWYYYGLATGSEEHFQRSKQIFQAQKSKFFIKVLEIK